MARKYVKIKKNKGARRMGNDLTKYMYDKMINDAKNYQWRIVHDSHKRAIEIYFVVSLEVQDEQYVQDINSQINRDNKIQLEDVVCVYDIKEHRILPENYLYALPFDNKTGIEEGKVDALLKQLNIIISTANSQIREFLLDNNQQEFSLEWNNLNFESTIETLINTNHYSTNRLKFVEINKESLVQQFKEEQNDGMERI